MNPGFVNATEMLPVPRAAGLAPEQIEGKRCVWCGGADTVELGPRLSVIGGTLKRWEPRACRPCTRREAGRVYDVHITACARCTHRDYCPDSKALYTLALYRQTSGLLPARTAWRDGQRSTPEKVSRHPRSQADRA